MSGSNKYKRYIVITETLVILAWLFAALLPWLDPRVDGIAWRCVGCVAAVLLSLTSVLIHELGHIVVGWICRMRLISVTVFRIRISRIDQSVGIVSAPFSEGKCEMIPSGNGCLKARLIAFSLGGVLFNFLYAAAFIALYCCLPYHFALMLFAAIAPVNLAEGLRALYPAEVNLSEGKTDGKIAIDLIKGTPSALLTMRIMQLHGALYEKTYQELDQELFYDVPNAEDDRYARLALLQLRLQYEDCCGNDDAAKACLEEIRLLSKEMPCEVQEEVEREIALYRMAAGEIAYEAETAQTLLDEIQKTPFKGLKAYEQRVLDRILQKRDESSDHSSDDC